LTSDNVKDLGTARQLDRLIGRSVLVTSIDNELELACRYMLA